MTTPHKHAALIKAWADGASIQWRDNALCEWNTSIALNWTANEYRVKPEAKPNVVMWQAVASNGAVIDAFLAAEYALAHHGTVAAIRIEINYNDPANPVLVSATLQKL